MRQPHTTAERTPHRQSARDIVALLDSLGIARVRAIGLSSGAMTLLHLATMQPDRVEAMILVSGTTHFPEQARVIGRGIAEGGLPPEVYQHFVACARRGVAQARELVREFAGIADSHGDMEYTRDSLAAIRARTLVIHGDRDQFFPVEIALDLYRGIPHSALWIVPGGGHVPIFGPESREFLRLALTQLAGPALTDPLVGPR